LGTLRTAGYTVLISALALLAGCSKQEKETEPVVTVQTAVARKMNLQQVVRTEAVLFARNQAAITPKVAAPVRKFYVNRGSRVHRGQLLATLENRDIAASVAENKGALEQAQAAYETTTQATLPEDLNKAEQDAKSAAEALDAAQRQYNSRQNLFQQGALPRKDLDQASVALVQAKAQNDLAQQHLAAARSVGKTQTLKSATGQLTSARGKYEGAAAQLSYTEIRSPIDGVVTDRPVYPGETPAQGTPLLTIMDTSSVIAKAHIPQDEASLLKVGDAATITAPGAEPVKGKVALVSPATDPNSTTVEVWIEAPNKAGTLRPGTTVQIEAVARSVPDAITIPAAAVLKTPEGANTVMVVGKDDRAHQTAVELGIQSGDNVQVTKGVNAGDTVVATGAYGLPDNTRVKAAPPAPAASDTKASAAEKD
jgi:multidrug efflux pump subunit AcrA (membrane-fusion protein)